MPRILTAIIFTILLIGLLSLAYLPMSSGGQWSVAHAQGCDPGTIPPCFPTPTPDPRSPREVPEADTLLLVGGGLGGLTTWLGWQLRARAKKK